MRFAALVAWAAARIAAGNDAAALVQMMSVGRSFGGHCPHFSAPNRGVYIPGCADKGCQPQTTLAAAQAACSAEPSCFGVTYQDPTYQLRKGPGLLNAGTSEISWVCQDWASATADPHCENLRGEAFDVFTVGAVPFIVVPRQDISRGKDLSVVAQVIPVSRSRCAPTTIQSITLGGRLLGENTYLNVSAGPSGLVFTGGLNMSNSGMPKETGTLGRGQVTTWKRGNRVHHVVIALNKMELEVRYRIGHSHGVQYLDFQAKHLTSLGTDIGGLLGFDGHSSDDKPLPGCEGKQTQAVLVDRDAVGEETAQGSFMISTAKAT